MRSGRTISEKQIVSRLERWEFGKPDNPAGSAQTDFPTEAAQGPETFPETCQFRKPNQFCAVSVFANQMSEAGREADPVAGNGVRTYEYFYIDHDRELFRQMVLLTSEAITMEKIPYETVGSDLFPET